MSRSEVTPEPPTFHGFVFMSCHVLMPEAAQNTQTEGSSVTLPIQVNFVASNRSPTARNRSFIDIIPAILHQARGIAQPGQKIAEHGLRPRNVQSAVEHGPGEGRH